MEEEQKEGQTTTPEDTQITSEEALKTKSSIARSRRERRRPRRINKKVFVIGLVVVLLAAGGYFLLQEPQIEVEPLSESEVAEEEIKEPTKTPTLIPVDKKDIKIEVLNGTGIAKEASFLSGQLQDLGYSDIEAGNTQEQDYSTTIVTYAKNVQDQVKDEVNDKLEEIYEDVDAREASLTDFDIQIIAGLRKGQVFPTETPVPSPTFEPTASPSPTATPSATLTP